MNNKPGSDGGTNGGEGGIRTHGGLSTSAVFKGAHTAGDVVVFCPQKRVVSTGDMIHGFLPYAADGYPFSWAKTIDAVLGRQFDKVSPGHGPVHQNRAHVGQMRNYIEEIVGRTADGKKAGKSVAELQKTINVASLKSLQADGYGKFVADILLRGFPNFGPPPPLQTTVNTNIEHFYANLARGGGRANPQRPVPGDLSGTKVDVGSVHQG